MSRHCVSSYKMKAFAQRSLSSLFLLALVHAFVPESALAVAIGDSEETVDMAQERVDRRVAAGLIVAGRAGIMGLDGEVNITESWSVGVSLGTGVDYTTVGVRGRFYLLSKYVNPFVGFGYSKWYTSHGIPRSGDVNPRTVVEDLLIPSQMESLALDGFNLDLLTPEVGIQYYSGKGYAISGAFIFLSNVSQGRGAPYGEFMVQWFF